MVRKRTKIGGQFAPRTIEMLRSPAMRVLSLSGRRVLDRIEIEMADHGGTENGRLPVTFADFEAFGIDRHAIAPALREAQALGFVEVTERGRAGNAEYRSPSLYRLTYRHTARQGPTDEWRKFETMEAALEAARSARAHKPTTTKKQISSGGKNHVSVGDSHTENELSPVGVSPTTGSPEKPPLLSISRGGVPA